jgi:GTP pyrophosphokinase
MSKPVAISPRDKILGDFDSCRDLYARFTRAIESLVSQLLHERGLKIHSVTSRAKDRLSLEKKIARRLGKYRVLTDITDISGVRIITHYPDEVDAVAAVIESEFTIDRKNSIDKRAALDPDRFGYLSLHYVCSLLPSRSALTEYRLFRDLVVEIQIRSIVQHAWAEIQHDLGYKSKVAIPKEAQRRFFQLAAMLELVDSEFGKLRAQVREYEASVETRVAANTVQDIAIDANSLAAYIGNNELGKQLDAFLTHTAKSTFDPKLDPQVAAARAAELSFIGVTQLSDLDARLRSHTDSIQKLAQLWLTRPGAARGGFSPGASIFYLSYFLAAEKGREFLLQYLKDLNIGTSEEQERLADDVLSISSKPN